jgi:hypothetical protein
MQFNKAQPSSPNRAVASLPMLSLLLFWAMPFSALAFAIIAIGRGFAFTANMLTLVMVDQINLKLTEKERIPSWAWDLTAGQKHKRLYPDSKLSFLFGLCWISTAVCFPILLWSMGFFGRR